MEPLDYEFTHVHVYASDPEVTVSWLTDGLGGEVVSRYQHSGYPAATLVRIGGQVVSVRGRRETERFAPANARTFGLDHFGLSVPDLESALEALHARGIEPETTFDNGFSVPPGVAFVLGPDQLWVEITPREFAPVASSVASAAIASGTEER